MFDCLNVQKNFIIPVFIQLPNSYVPNFEPKMKEMNKILEKQNKKFWNDWVDCCGTEKREKLYLNRKNRSDYDLIFKYFFPYSTTFRRSHKFFEIRTLN